MSGNTPKTAGNSPAPAAEDKPMSAVVEARHLIADIAGPMPAGAQIQEMLTLVARRTGLGVRRLRGIWNSEARAIRAEELDALREAATSRREEQDRHEYRSIVKRLAFLENRLAEIDPGFPRPMADAGCERQRGAGRVARPLAGGR